MESIKKYFSLEEGKIKNNYTYNFEVPENGLYLIEIIANARSWWQNILKIKFGDDDLTVKIDNTEFPKLNGKRGLFDSEVAWNGNNLRGLSKTSIFIINLSAGTHAITFIADKNPILKSLRIEKINDNEILYIPEDNNPSEDGDRRQWMVIALKDLPLKTLNIKAVAKSYPDQSDQDDLKLIIDGEIQLNNENHKKHAHWYWSGKLLNGNEEEFNRELNLANGMHYIELWADRMPVLNSIKLSLGSGGAEGNKRTGKVALYKDIEAASYVNLRRSFNLGSDVIAELRDGTIVEMIEEMVEGEEVPNKSSIWHKVKYQDMEGYILSSFVEIEGQSRQQVVENIINRAKNHGIDEDYAIALAGCESQFKPYAVSYSGALGVFQLTSVARKQLRENLNFNISDNNADVFNVDKNIEAGIVYLKYLFDIYNSQADSYKKITAAWNAGQSVIPVNGPINYDLIGEDSKKQETQNLVGRVELNRKRKEWNYILLSLAMLLMLAAATFHFIWENRFGGEKAYALESQIEKNVASDIAFRFDHPFEGIKSIKITSESSAMAQWYTKVRIEHYDETEEKVYSGYLDNAYLFSDFSRKLFIVRQNGKFIDTSVLEYNFKNKTLEEVKFIDQDGNMQNNLCCSYIIFKPHNNYGVDYDFIMRHYPLNYESVYESEYSDSGKLIFRETKRQKIEEGPSS